jgi:hypothetical protein
MSTFPPEPVSSHGSGGGSGAGRAAAPPADASVRILRRARSMVGTNFHAGQKEQCAAFVRAVYSTEGIRLPIAKRPPDLHLLPPGEGVGEAHANSLAGEEIGAKIPENQARPGDIVLYKNTYGSYKPGVITHVAIYAGNSEIIHRPTAARPVCVERLHYAQIAEIRRPFALGHAAALSNSHSTKIFLHDGRMSALRDGAEVNRMEVRIQYRNGAMRIFIDGKEVRAKNLELQIFG